MSIEFIVGCEYGRLKTRFRLGTSLPAQDVSDNEWLTSLPRVGTPSIVSPLDNVPPTNTPPPDSPSHVNREELESLRVEVQNQRQTISLLVSEKMSLSTSLGRLSDVSSRTFNRSATRSPIEVC